MPTFTTAAYDQQKETRAYTISGGSVTVSPSRDSAPNVVSGTVEYAVIPYTMAGTEAAADIINLCMLPPGAIPVPQLSRVTSNASPGTAFTIKIGVNADDDGLATAVALTSAARDLSFVNAGATQPAFITATPVTADTGLTGSLVFATVSTATAPGTAVLTFTIAYKRGR